MSTISGTSNKVLSRLQPLRRDSKTSAHDLTKYDFIVGDRVYIASNPDRLGTTVFNGTTRFSDGLWIGVALDDPFGKNNGVVQGITYFQCEENHGIFVRPNNLRHASDKKLNVFNNSENDISVDDRLNNSSLLKGSEELSFAKPFPVSISHANLNLGDRVYVAGKSSSSMHKNGILRFFGFTKFAEGTWAGIELDNPVGKNDGSVNGVRYFSCKPQYGLFALENKVSKLDLSTMKGLSRMESYSKYGSNESISSIASNFSSASRTRVRLGMNAVSTPHKLKGDITDRMKSSKINTKDLKDLDKASSAIHNVLKEKELHVEQLMREREIERIDFATATAKIDELEKHQSKNISSFNDQKLILDKKMMELQNSAYTACQERDHALERLEEEKKKVEDLMFRIEEKNIDESDLEHKTEENESQIFELNEKLSLERELREQLERKLKSVSPANENSVDEIKYLSQIKNLEGKILKLEFELSGEKKNAKMESLSKSLEEKDALVNDLKDRFEEAKSKLNATKKELDSVKKLQSTQIDENKSLKSDIVDLQSFIEKLNIKLSEVQKEIKLEIVPNPDVKIKNYSEEEFESQVKEILNLKESVDILRKENENVRSKVAMLNEESELRRRDAEDKQTEFGDLRQRYELLETEKVDLVKSKRLLAEENDKLSTQLSSYAEQLGKLRSQVSDLHNDNKRIADSKYEIEHNEKNLKIVIDQLKSQISFLEKENGILSQSLDESENDAKRNSSILQMSLKIEDMESVIQDLQVLSKSDKEQNMSLITKNATLYAELEHLKQKRDDEDNAIYDQLQSIKSINELLESDKISVSENLESKNKELIIIRDRLLKTSQDYENLKDTFNENNQKFEREKRLLMEKIRKAEKQMDEHDKKSQFSLSESTEKRKSDGKDQISLLKAAKENSEQQISFLNNVIVDREKKCNLLQLENQSLKEKITDLENGNVRLPLTKPKKPVTMRVYCDVCEIFDCHDTAQCTVSVNDSTPSSPQLLLRSVKKASRAPRLYCDICEIFDAHDTSDCQDQQTY